MELINAQNQPNSPVRPRLLDKAPECQMKGCNGNVVAVYHCLDSKSIGLRLYSGVCWVHQNWNQWKAVKGGLMESGQIPLHSRLNR